jgi:Asp/Glu/hydantoin racemase
MSAAGPRVALIHAVAVAIDPTRDAFAELWPEAQTFNLLDDALSPDRAANAELTAALCERIVALGRYAHSAGADGILYTCSAFGPAIETAARNVPVPVRKPNEAMFREALQSGKRIGMLATFEPSVAPMAEEFGALAADRGGQATLETRCVPEAMRALRAGDGATHDALLAAEARRLAHCDAVMLAHFSTGRAHAAVSQVLGCPVLTAPRSAVVSLRRAIQDARA